MVNRRHFLKLLAMGVVGHTLDVDKLLWVPGQKTIFIPHPKQIDFYNGIPYHQTNASTRIWLGFERADYFYRKLKDPIEIVSDRQFRIPLKLDGDKE